MFVEHPARRPVGARAHPAAVVLQAAVDVVGMRVVHRHAVVLGERQRGDVEELQAAVVADADAAVVELHHVAGVFRVHPHEAIVAVGGRARRRERLAAVIREGIRIQHVDALVVVRIDGGLACVHRPRVPVRHERPRAAAIVAAIQPGPAGDVGRRGVVARALFDAHVDHVRVLAIHGDADAAVLTLGQAVAGELRPGGAAVGALPERAAGAAAVEAEGRAPALVAGGVEDRRIAPVHRHVGHAGVVVHVQRACPGPAAVACHIEPAVAARPPH